MDATGSPTGTRRPRRCIVCGEAARFLTPGGMMCPGDAIRAATEEPGPDGWLPILIDQPDRASNRGDGRPRDAVTGSA